MTPLNIVFTPDQLAGFEPADGSLIIAVCAFRAGGVFADACEYLRGGPDTDRPAIPFQAVNLTGVRKAPAANPIDMARAELLLAEAVAISFGHDRGTVYSDTVHSFIVDQSQ